MNPNGQRRHRKQSQALLIVSLPVVGLLITAAANAQDIEVSPNILAQQQATGPIRLPPVQSSVQTTGHGPNRPRLQNNFPSELVLPPPSERAKRDEARFIPTSIDPELSLKLVVGRPKVLQLSQTPKRIYTPSDTTIRTEIIDDQSGKEIAVTGLEAGTTTLIFWFDDEDAPGGQSTVAYEVRVFEDPLFARPTKELEADLNKNFPNSNIELDEIANRLIVRGQAPDAIELSQILRILAGARGVRPGITPTATTRQTVLQANNFSTGQETDFFDLEDAEQKRILDPIALARAGIINQMKIVGEQQVMLKVTVAEVNRTAARSIGLNFSVDNNNGLTVFQTLTGPANANVLASLDMGQVSLAIEALRTMNLSRTLAEPNLVAMNGQPASFQAGGQFPIPVISGGGGGGNNLQGVSFVPFGVQLQFTPFIQDRDVVRLQMNAEVSTRDESVGTNIGSGGGGTQVSGLNSRNFSTTVQLRSGQTIAVAGLLQTNYGANTSRVPLWGDLPFIGSTGGVNSSSLGEQELVILVTPHLVAPVDACSAPAVPGSDVHEPTDIEFFVANRLESRRSRDYRSAVRTDFARQKQGESCCPERFMIGAVGPTDRCCPRPTPAPHAAVPSTVAPYPAALSPSDETATPVTSGDAFEFAEPIGPASLLDQTSFPSMIRRGTDVQ